LDNLSVCPVCGFHFRLSATERLTMFFDDGQYSLMDQNIFPQDPLQFEDSMKYSDRLKEHKKRTSLQDAVLNAEGKMGGFKVIISAMEFAFMGGSMGSVVGEKITRAAELALKERLPYITVSCSGGARMQEGVLSLMQLMKTSSAIANLNEASIPFISVLADPTTGGVTASLNGKGSVCAMLAQILILHNFRVGLFTSPHLVRVEERIQIGNKLIPPRSFCRWLTILRERIEQLIASKKLLSPPTYFELLTCLAFLYFEEQKVDIAVLEVGMGGRFDATNVVEPSVSVITTISGEHKKFLGETMSQIAFEKAGIVKRGIPVVCGVEEGEARETIKKRAEKLKAPFHPVFAGERSFITQKTGKGYSFVYRKGKENYSFTPSLQGKHQGKNAAVIKKSPK